MKYFLRSILGGLWALSFITIVNATGFHQNSEDENQPAIQKVSKRDLVLQIPKTDWGASCQILHGVYESASRGIKGAHKYGQSFPINPEMLSELIRDIRGKRVLEMAGASGENALLLAAAGAGCVYLNDIVPEEIMAFEQNKSKFPAETQNRLTAICGDMFDLEDSIEAESLDVIIARNIFHFLRPSQFDSFFDLTSGLLKPGGRIYINVNGRYNEVSHFPDTIFRFSTLTLYRDHFPIPGTHMPLDQVLKECTEDLDPTDFKNTYVVEAGKIIKGEVKKLPPKLKKNLQKQYNDKSVYIRVLQNTHLLFTPKNLSEMFIKGGFIPLETHYIGADGHYIDAKHVESENSHFVNLVAQKPTA